MYGFSLSVSLISSGIISVVVVMLLDTSLDNSGAVVVEVGTVVVTDVELELDTVSSDTVVVLEADVSDVSGTVVVL